MDSVAEATHYPTYHYSKINLNLNLFKLIPSVIYITTLISIMFRKVVLLSVIYEKVKSLHEPSG